MAYEELSQQVDGIRSKLTPALIEETVRKLMRQGENVGGGVNAIRLVKCLLANPRLMDAEASWAYDRLKPALRSALEQIPSLCFFEGD